MTSRHFCAFARRRESPNRIPWARCPSECPWSKPCQCDCAAYHYSNGSKLSNHMMAHPIIAKKWVLISRSFNPPVG